jgi:hypothetical protein
MKAARQGEVLPRMGRDTMVAGMGTGAGGGGWKGGRDGHERAGGGRRVRQRLTG